MNEPGLAGLSATPSNIEAIVRNVLSQLKQSEIDELHDVESSGSDAVTLSLSGVISLETLKQIDPSTRTVLLTAGALITPAAADELRDRGIHVERSCGQSNTASPMHSEAFDPSQPILKHPDRAIAVTSDQACEDQRSAVTAQLGRKNIALHPSGSTEIHISDQPAAALARRFAAGKSAVVISRLSDITRFAAEISPQTFVLDHQHLNLMQLIYAATTISRLGQPTQSKSAK
ncbi:MAG: hypothetical protein AAF539_04460 [Planctomycetota bacterium]